MSFWKNSGYEYKDIIDMPFENIILLINSMTREDLIAWLSWNDRNGIYEDEQSLKELGTLMTREEGIEILLKQVEENRVPTK